MATVYIDKSAATDGSGTESSPRNVVPTISAGDSLYFAGGVDIGEQITVAADNVTIDSYGNGLAEINGAGTLNYGVYATSVSGLTVRRLEIHDVLKNGVLIENDTASTTETDIVVEDCHVWNVGLGTPLTRANEAQIRIGTGICVGSGPTTGLSVINRVRIDRCEVHDCGAHGIDVRWRTLNVSRKRCHVYRTGLWVGSHGITAHPIALTITSGWSVVSGNVYSRARTSTNDVEQLLINTTDAVVMTKVGGTSPALNEWSVDATLVYINIGGSPTGKSFVIKRHAHGPFRDEGHVVHDVVDYDGIEGHGIDTDDATGPAEIIGCKSYSNEGHGFFSFRGEDVTRQSCQAWGNAKSGFSSTLVDTPIDYCNTSTGNALRGYQWDGGKTGQVKNCYAGGNGTAGTVTTGTGFTVSGTFDTMDDAGIAVYGNLGSSEVSGVTADVTADSLLTSAGRPLPASPLLAGGADLGYIRDVEGKQSKSHIGAYAAATLLEVE